MEIRFLGLRDVDLAQGEGVAEPVAAGIGDAEAIAFANDLRDQEEPQVRDRVTFVEADAFSYEAPAGEWVPRVWRQTRRTESVQWQVPMY